MIDVAVTIIVQSLFTMTASNSELRRWGSVWTVSQAKVYDRVMAERTHSDARSFCPWIYDQKQWPLNSALDIRRTHQQLTSDSRRGTLAVIVAGIAINLIALTSKAYMQRQVWKLSENLVEVVASSLRLSAVQDEKALSRRFLFRPPADPTYSFC